MFLAADQLRSQGYPGFANSHGKGAALRAEERGGRGETEEGRESWPFSPRMRAKAQGESNPRAVSSDKVGLGPGRKRKMAPRPLKASQQQSSENFAIQNPTLAIKNTLN